MSSEPRRRGHPRAGSRLHFTGGSAGLCTQRGDPDQASQGPLGEPWPWGLGWTPGQPLRGPGMGARWAGQGRGKVTALLGRPQDVVLPGSAQPLQSPALRGIRRSWWLSRVARGTRGCVGSRPPRGRVQMGWGLQGVGETSKPLGSVSPSPQMETARWGGTQRPRPVGEGCWGKRRQLLWMGLGGTVSREPARRGEWGHGSQGGPYSATVLPCRTQSPGGRD